MPCLLRLPSPRATRCGLPRRSTKLKPQRYCKTTIMLCCIIAVPSRLNQFVCRRNFLIGDPEHIRPEQVPPRARPSRCNARCQQHILECQPRAALTAACSSQICRQFLSGVLKIYQPQWAILLGLLWLKVQQQQQQQHPSQATPQYTKNSSAAAKRPRSCPQQTLITQYTVHLCTLGAFPCQH